MIDVANAPYSAVNNGVLINSTDTFHANNNMLDDDESGVKSYVSSESLLKALSVEEKTYLSFNATAFKLERIKTSTSQTLHENASKLSSSSA